MYSKFRLNINCVWCTINILLLINCINIFTIVNAYPTDLNSNHDIFGTRSLARRHTINVDNGNVNNNNNNNNNNDVIMGKFKAPSPDRIYRSHLTQAQNDATQMISASMMVTDRAGNNNNNNEKIVYGIFNNQKQQKPTSNQRVVSAKFQVSDEGLNYPPSKVSADIHGNLAEIVTAPPNAVVDADLFTRQDNGSQENNGDENKNDKSEKLHHLKLSNKKKLYKRERQIRF